MFDSPKRHKRQKRNKRNKRICQIAMRSIDDLSFEVIILRVDGGGSHGMCHGCGLAVGWVDGLMVWKSTFPPIITSIITSNY